MARTRMPSASPASIIRGKIVTISNCIDPRAVSESLAAREVQVQQAVQRLNDNRAPRQMHPDDNCLGERNQNLAGRRALHDQPASLARSLDARHLSNRDAFGGFDRASDEIVLIEASRGQRM